MGWGAVLVLLGQWSIGFLSFFTPKRLGAFGGTVVAGNAADFKVGDVKPSAKASSTSPACPRGSSRSTGSARTWAAPCRGLHQDPAMPGPPDGGDLAFTDKGRFKCPCHGSIYNRYGQIIQGPAPRPMDLFPMAIDAHAARSRSRPGRPRHLPPGRRSSDARAATSLSGRAAAWNSQPSRADHRVFLLLVLGAVLWYAARVAEPLPEAPGWAAHRRAGDGAQDHRHRGHDRGAWRCCSWATASASPPVRRSPASNSWTRRSVAASTTSASLCFPCHGEKGQGAVVPDFSPDAAGASAEPADLRPTDSDERTKEYDFIFKTIQRGRPGTPMPDVGSDRRRTLLDEHINELTLMILNGDRQVMFEGKLATPWEHTADVVNEHVAQGLVAVAQAARRRAAAPSTRR